MKSRKPSRRAFLRRTGLIAASGLMLPACGVMLWPDLQTTAAEMAGFLRRRKLANGIGRTYLADHGMLETASVDAVARRLLDMTQLDLDGLTYLDVSELKRRLAARIREDFAAEEVAVVEGWLLSVTEAHLCALSYLYHERA